LNSAASGHRNTIVTSKFEARALRHTFSSLPLRQPSSRATIEQGGVLSGVANACGGSASYLGREGLDI
jgi:hypothetical protein